MGAVEPSPVSFQSERPVTNEAGVNTSPSSKASSCGRKFGWRFRHLDRGLELRARLLDRLNQVANMAYLRIAGDRGPRQNQLHRAGAQTERRGGAGPVGACLAVRTPPAAWFWYSTMAATLCARDRPLRQRSREPDVREMLGSLAARPHRLLFVVCDAIRADRS